MKSIHWSLLVCTIVMLLAAWKGNPSKEKKTSPIDGAWKLVWAKWNDKLVDVSKNPQTKFFADGCFSLISTAEGKIDFAGYGTFELQQTSYQETFLYHNSPEFVGAMDWQEIEIKGDTMYAKGFKKVVIQGKERTDFPVIEEKRVRMP